ncbi:hypothetical protein ACFL6Q_01700 [Candidatus Neomarinimicrobiota bacterium]
MFRELIGPIEGVSVYQIVALLLFLGVFIVLAVRSFLIDRKTLNHLKRLPLDTDTDSNITGDEESA